MVEWKNKRTVMKGDVGEKIIDNFLKDKGIIPYRPIPECVHPFDRLCSNKDGSIVFIADIKTKARRKYYPDTGIDLCHFNKYQAISEKYGVKVFIFFVDEGEQRIYGNYLHVLNSKRIIVWDDKTLEYPIKSNNIIYFPIQLMRDICSLSKEKTEELKQLSTRSYEY